jgi:hypothetical protein
LATIKKGAACALNSKISSLFFMKLLIFKAVAAIGKSLNS